MLLVIMVMMITMDMMMDMMVMVRDALSAMRLDPTGPTDRQI